MIKRALLYTTLVTLALYALRYLHYTGLRKQTRGYYGKLNQAFNQPNSYNLLFIGSSRAEMHYNPRIFDSITGLNSFNLGLPGATPLMALAALKTYMAGSKAPEHVVYEVDFHMMKVSPEVITDFNNFFPYLRHPVLRREFGKVDKRMPLFYGLPYCSFPFTGLKNISTGLHGWLGIPNQSDSLYYKGHLSERSGHTLDYIARRPEYGFINPLSRTHVDSLIAFCRQHRIQLWLATSPFFAGGEVDFTNCRQLRRQAENIALANRLPYFNFMALPICSKRQLFVDHHHLNSAGADMYTRAFSEAFNNKRRLFPLNGK